jgi:hypothetical protein
MKTKAAKITPRIKTPNLGVATSMIKPELKFYKSEIVQKHQNASGEELKEKEPLKSYFTSGYFIDENGNPIVSEYESVNGYYNGKNYNMQREIINKNG